MADEDMFGDSSLFEEFDKERDASGSFIFYEKDEHGSEDRSRIIFQLSDSSSDEDSDDESKQKVAEQSVAHAVKTLQKQNEKFAPINGDLNTLSGEQNGINDDADGSSSEEEAKPTAVVSKDRMDKSTTFKLNYERNKFKRFCNIIDSTRFIHEEESAGVQVIYQNNSFSRKYKTQIEDYIRYLIGEDSRTPQERLQKLDLKSTVPSCADLNDKIPVEKRTDRMFQAHAILGCSQFYRGFMFDTLGWPMVEYNPSLTESWDIPTYEQVYEDILPVDAELIKAKERKKEKERAKPKCWNCDGDHMLGECKEPRNQQKINENKRLMMANAQQKGPTGPKSQRYHKETATEEKFKPGKISAELREALGIGEDQLPMYIYKMRAFGYPPGWLEEAKPEADGLAMFDVEGKEVDTTAENAGAPQLDVEKIIEYPGFTVEAVDCVEEADVYGLPPIQPHQLKTTLMASVRQQESMKRAQEMDEEQETAKRMKITHSDMDLEDAENSNSSDFQPPLPPETPPTKPPAPECTPPTTPDVPALSRESSQSRSDSPSLEELEAQYQMLQKSLLKDGDTEEGEVLVLDSYEDDSQQSAPTVGEGSDNPIDVDSQDELSGDRSNNPIVVGDESMNDSDVEFLKPKLTRVGSTSSIQTFGELGSGSPMNSQPSTPQPSPSIDMSKPMLVGSASVSRDYGTPILKRVGSVEILPTDSKFSQGIEDHIPFENLPDSTGTYEKMRKLIGRIRGKLPTRKKKS